MRSTGWAAQFRSSTSCQVRPRACAASGSFRGLYLVVAEVDFSGPFQTFYNMLGQQTRGWATEEIQSGPEEQVLPIPPPVSTAALTLPGRSWPAGCLGKS